jgi:competence ComEA-like helix-hairpin-helix protein
LKRPSFSGTRWFHLSGRELLVLAGGLAIVLTGIAIAGIAGRLQHRNRIEIRGTVEVLPPPARLNVNTATPYELDAIRGIGPRTAEAIVRSREEKGPFASLEDLVTVPGIGPQTIAALRPHVMCAPPR